MQLSALTVRKESESGRWIFDDPAVGLVREPFVFSATAILDRMAAHIPDAGNGIRLVFSDQPFEGAECLERVESIHSEEREDLAVEGLWTQYHWPSGGLSGWLCPNLMRYFERPPARLYGRCEPLE